MSAKKVQLSSRQRPSILFVQYLFVTVGRWPALQGFWFATIRTWITWHLPYIASHTCMYTCMHRCIDTCLSACMHATVLRTPTCWIILVSPKMGDVTQTHPGRSGFARWWHSNRTPGASLGVATMPCLQPKLPLSVIISHNFCYSEGHRVSENWFESWKTAMHSPKNRS